MDKLLEDARREIASALKSNRLLIERCNKRAGICKGSGAKCEGSISFAAGMVIKCSDALKEMKKGNLDPALDAMKEIIMSYKAKDFPVPQDLIDAYEGLGKGLDLQKDVFNHLQSTDPRSSILKQSNR